MDDSLLNIKDTVTVKKFRQGLCSRRGKILLCVGLILLVIVCAALVMVFHSKDGKTKKFFGWCGVVETSDLDSCHNLRSSSCNVSLVESIPENLTFAEGSPSHRSVFDGWMKLLDDAQSSIHIASSYWSLRADDIPVRDPSSWQGEKIFNRLVEAGKRGIDIKIVHQVSTDSQPNNDTIILEKMGLAQVRSLNMERLVGAGILHSKMWLVDNKHFYVGSANLDWRSLTQIKELGLVTSSCPCLGEDMAKIFNVYWMLAQPGSEIPDKWPENLKTSINKDHPLSLTLNGDKSNVYLSSSPPPLCPDGRTSDIDSILDVIQKAQKFVHVSVMDYAPVFLYQKPQKYWGEIDNALRDAAFNRGVKVYVMASMWPHTKHEMIPFLKSLAVLNDIYNVDIQVRLFCVPNYTEAQAKIPFARVQHTKYMVTDNAAYVGTSNWSGDYFVSTAGIGYVINQTIPLEDTSSSTTIQQQLEAVFLRDWNSNYTKSIWDYNYPTIC